ncbi:ferritin subunit [Bradysia coprophila]|uniref:ferritin subunit n=1 Tax=Bradysia coprophila TaxID=38358 RepID=UPI00187DD41F|nr:ferritin subunit [Bradysia coprophila]
MKSILIAVLVIVAVTSSNAKLQCDVSTAYVPTEWLDMTGGCIGEMRRQIQAEINASIKYLAMGAYFAQDTVNRPGFADFFFKSASEEREHATKLIEYLLMRTQLSSVGDLIKVNAPETTSWKQGLDALEDALKTEAAVTKSIKQVIQKCEDDDKNNDYHLVDYLTGEFLEEQYRGQRDLAGKISTLKKMMKSNTNGQLGEFLFDKQLH